MVDKGRSISAAALQFTGAVSFSALFDGRPVPPIDLD
jgi:hypothetical protein